MPVAYIKSLSAKGYGSISSLEKKWAEAKKSAEEQGKKKNWAYIVGIFKKLADVKESTQISGEIYYRGVRPGNTVFNVKRYGIFLTKNLSTAKSYAQSTGEVKAYIVDTSKFIPPNAIELYMARFGGGRELMKSQQMAAYRARKLGAPGVTYDKGETIAVFDKSVLKEIPFEVKENTMKKKIVRDGKVVGEMVKTEKGWKKVTESATDYAENIKTRNQMAKDMCVELNSKMKGMFGFAYVEDGGYGKLRFVMSLSTKDIKDIETSKFMTRVKPTEDCGLKTGGDAVIVESPFEMSDGLKTYIKSYVLKHQPAGSKFYASISPSGHVEVAW